ncbi:hypothetical protein C7H11_03345 [Escherichia coli]|nr:hypothetical protein C7H11_03345 [Escherichia coli]
MGKPLYQDLLFRTKAALQKNPKNVLLAICWMQGEFDMTNASYAQQPAAFLAMVQQFRADLAGLAAQCHGGSPASVPWICGDTTYAWKQEHGTQYEVVYGAYKGKESQQIYFVPFMTDGSGVNTPTNNPSEDPDIAGSGYYGSASRTNKNWVSSNRPTHFSSWARRGIIPDRMATAILNVAGRTLAFISGKAPEIKPSPGGDTGKYTAQDATTAQKGIIQLSSATNSTSETLAATPKAVKAANDNAEKRLQKDQNGADIPGKDTFTKNIGACRAFGGSVSTTTGNWTTAQFIEWLDSQGAFNHPYWMCKGSWSYGNNKIITDTGCGNIHLAGAVIESASSASASKDEATRQASAAKGSATTASTKATEAAGSATAAAQSKSTAESAATRAETAAKRAEDIASAVALEDASTTKKGIVQLSSATNSTSESLAATPKAVKAVMGETNKKAPLNSPALTGTPTTPTARQGTNNTQIASTA